MKLTGQKLDNSNSHSKSHSNSHPSRSCSRSWCNAKVWHQIKPINQQEKHFERGHWEGVLQGGTERGYCQGAPRKLRQQLGGPRNTFTAQQQLPKCRHLWQPQGRRGEGSVGAWLANRITKLLLKSWTNIGVSRILWGNPGNPMLLQGLVLYVNCFVAFGTNLWHAQDTGKPHTHTHTHGYPVLGITAMRTEIFNENRRSTVSLLFVNKKVLASCPSQTGQARPGQVQWNLLCSGSVVGLLAHCRPATWYHPRSPLPLHLRLLLNVQLYGGKCLSIFRIASVFRLRGLDLAFHIA